MSETQTALPMVHGGRIPIRDGKIQFADKWYDLIMCYRCGICGDPLIAFWKVADTGRLDAGTVGRALEDSGFGSYRFFETEAGQGVEYDYGKDNRKRHAHPKSVKPYTYSYTTTPTEHWIVSTILNPLIAVDTFFSPKKAITTEDEAIAFIESLRGAPWMKVMDDMIKHGKPIFMFNRISDEYGEVKKAAEHE